MSRAYWHSPLVNEGRPLFGAVAFCIFGDNEMYSIGAQKQLQLFTDYSVSGPVHWTCHFYVGDSVSDETCLKLIQNGGKVIRVMDEPEDQTATFWRFAIFQQDYDFFLIRDTDSRLCKREKAATSEWIHLGHDFHVMRDHPFHNVPILAGLWGCTRHAREEVAAVCDGFCPPEFYKECNAHFGRNLWESNDFYQVDQMWLRMKVWPIMSRRKLAHSEFILGYEGRYDRREFPTKRERNEFVGKGWNADDTERLPEHSEMVNPEYVSPEKQRMMAQAASGFHRPWYNH